MKKIGILQTAFLGDTALVACMIDKIEELYGSEFELHLILKKGLEEIFKYDKRVSSIIALDKRGKQKGVKGTLNTIFKIRELGLDVLFNVHRSIRSSLIASFSGAKKLISFRDSPVSLRNSKRVSRRGAHEVIKNHLLLEAFDEDFRKIRPEPNGKYKLFSMPQKESKLLSKLGKDPYIIVAPGSKWPTKRWPPKYYSELCNLILENTNYDIIFTGDKDDKNVVSQILKNILNGKYKERLINLCGKLSISELMSVISNSKLVVTNDSAPVHLAGGLDVPVVAIFGPTTKELGYYPYDEISSIIEPLKVECRPCGMHGHLKCPKKTHECMNSIEVKELWLAVLKHI